MALTRFDPFNDRPKVGSAKITETIPMAVLFWDEGLFFEFHELLEILWTMSFRVRGGWCLTYFLAAATHHILF